MKKYLFTVLSLIILTGSVKSQDAKPDKGADFDKKFRFGLRVAAQPSWFASTDAKNKPFNSVFGFGFGLNMEFRLSDIVAVSTGIGGDFEGGNLRYNYDPANNYTPVYWQNNGGEFVEPKGKNYPDLNNASNTLYVLDTRTIKTTHATIPIALKLSTREYSGFKYFGMFGGELGIRVKTTATDHYFETYKFDQAGVVTQTTGVTSQENINISKDGFIPLRIGFNAGLGTEFRIAGSTSAFLSVNYFRSFTNLMKSESKFMVYNIDSSSGTNSYNFVKQNLLATAIRINVGILF